MKRQFVFVVATALLVTGTAAINDPFVGKWVLNVQKSKYPAGTCPKEMVIEMESADGGVLYRSHTTYANGQTSYAQYTARYDGRPAIVLGAHGLMWPVSLKRIDSRTIVATYTKSLQVVATSRRVVCRNGHQMTVTTVSQDRSGKKMTTIGVYDKAGPAANFAASELR